MSGAGIVVATAGHRGDEDRPQRERGHRDAAEWMNAMRRERPMVDQRPGTLPDIRTDAGSITFTMLPAGIPGGEQLVIRCDARGDIWIAIQPERTPLH